MTLRQVIDRIGAKKFAQRLSITERTVQRWLKSGQVSPKYANRVRKFLIRSEGAFKAAATKKERDEFQRSIAIPDAPYADLAHPLEHDDLTHKEVTPREPPTTSESVTRLEGEGVDESIINTARWQGYTEWRMPGGFEGVDVREVDWDAVKADVIDTFKRSRHDACSTLFLFARYIPFNPTYTGEAIKKQGTWQAYWVSTKYESDDERIEAALDDEIAQVRKWSHTRVIFLKRYGVKVLKAKTTPLPPRVKHQDF